MTVDAWNSGNPGNNPIDNESWESGANFNAAPPHSWTTHRDAANSHPISAITGLQAALASAGGQALTASVVIYAPTLTPENLSPADGDDLYWVFYKPSHVGAGDGGAELDDWETFGSEAWNTQWVTDNDPANVLLILQGELEPTVLAAVTPTGFEQITVMGGQPVMVGCVNGGGTAWVGINNAMPTHSNPFDPTQPATVFRPVWVNAHNVVVSLRDQWFGGLDWVIQDFLGQTQVIDTTTPTYINTDTGLVILDPDTAGGALSVSVGWGGSRVRPLSVLQISDGPPTDWSWGTSVRGELVEPSATGEWLNLVWDPTDGTSAWNAVGYGPSSGGGAAATVDVGTTSTGAPGSSASVLNSGTTSAAVFDFIIPQGDKGDPGDPGSPGDQGNITVVDAQLGADVDVTAVTLAEINAAITGGTRSVGDTILVSSVAPEDQGVYEIVSATGPALALVSPQPTLGQIVSVPMNDSGNGALFQLTATGYRYVSLNEILALNAHRSDPEAHAELFDAVAGDVWRYNHTQEQFTFSSTELTSIPKADLLDWGFDVTPDNQACGFLVGATGVTRRYITKGGASVNQVAVTTVTGPLGWSEPRELVTIADLPSGFDYQSGGPVVDLGGGVGFMILHFEDNDIGSFSYKYWNLHGAKVVDDGSTVTITYLGPIIEHEATLAEVQALNLTATASSGQFALWDGSVYVYYNDFDVAGQSRATVASCSVTDIETALGTDTVPAFSKWNGESSTIGWSSAGLGGPTTTNASIEQAQITDQADFLTLPDGSLLAFGMLNNDLTTTVGSDPVTWAPPLAWHTYDGEPGGGLSYPTVWSGDPTQPKTITNKTLIVEALLASDHTDTWNNDYTVRRWELYPSTISVRHPIQTSADYYTLNDLNLTSLTEGMVIAAGGTTISLPTLTADSATWQIVNSGPGPVTVTALTEIPINGVGDITILAGHTWRFSPIRSSNLWIGWLDAGAVPTGGDTGTVLAKSSIDDYATEWITLPTAPTVTDALVFKGSIDCSSNPNYPAATLGETYRVSVAGKIGAGSGLGVEPGDLLICIADTIAGTQAAVGANWDVVQANLDGAVIGPVSSTDGAVVLFDGATGKLIKGGGTLGTAAFTSSSAYDAAGAAAAVSTTTIGAVPTSRTVAGKALSADITLASTDISGLGNAATRSVGTTTGTVAAGNDSRITGALQASNNLSDVTAATARTNLGLGTAATSASTDFQPIDSDLTAIAALTTTTVGRSLLAAADAAALRTILALGTAATANTGTGTSNVILGNDARLSDTRTPTDNSVTSAKIVDGTIVDADVNASAAIVLSKLATDPLARANHTGTQLGSTISDIASYIGGGSLWNGLSGNYLSPAALLGASSGTTLSGSANVLYFVPIAIPRAMSVDRIAVSINTASSGNAARVGIYSAGTDGRPSALILDCGTVSMTTISVQEITISQALSRGLVWLAVVANAAPGFGAVDPQLKAAFTTNGGYTAVAGLSQAFTYAALPASVTATGTASRIPDLRVRIV